MPQDLSLKKRPAPRAKLTDDEVGAKIKILAACNGPLAPHEIELLDEVFPYIIPLHEPAMRAVFRDLQKADSDDLTQRTLLSIHTRLCEGSPILEFRRTLIGIACAQRFDYFRGRRRDPVECGLPTSSMERPDSLGAEERNATLIATYVQVYDALEPINRQIVVLMYEAGVPRREIAELLELSEGAVSRRLVDIREAFRAALDDSTLSSREGAR